MRLSEHFDGSGYPFQVSGEAIPIEARIIHAVESYVVMRTGRPYKKPISHARAFQELERHAGCQFDPKVVEALKAVLPKTKSAEDSLEAVWKEIARPRRSV